MDIREKHGCTRKQMGTKRLSKNIVALTTLMFVNLLWNQKETWEEVKTNLRR